jgi:SHS2 domain-containing protein
VNFLERGHREVEHAADWGLEVWAPDLFELLGVVVSEEDRCHRELEIAADDGEQLLVSFLDELLFLTESENIAVDGFLLKLVGDSLLARLEGGAIVSREKEIKAVTFHQLAIKRAGQGLRTRIIFDV